MKCIHVKHKGELWTLDLDADPVVIRNPAGEVRAEFATAEAAEVFLLPSFSESIKQFRAPVDGELWYFDVAKDDLKTIKAFKDRMTVAAGPEAILAVRSRAIRDALIGAAAVVGGIALTVGSFITAANNPQGGSYFITYGLVLFGLVMLGKGAYGYNQYTHLKRLSDAPDQPQ
jgi:hypothetical protein